MVYCAVVGCSSNNNKNSKNSLNLTYRYFSFPISKDVCKLWVQNCYQKHKFNVKTARICSRHFSDDDYCLKEKLLQLPKSKWKLKVNAIPSLNLIKPPQVETDSQKKRNRKMENRNFVKNIHHLTEKHELANNGEVMAMCRDNVELNPSMETQSTGIDKNRNMNIQQEDTDNNKVPKRPDETCKLSEEMKLLQNENMHLKELRKEEAESKSIKQLFTEGQLRKLKTGKQIIWSVEDLTSAISLYAGGPSSYRLLKKRGYPLPSISTLRRWATKINLQPDILDILSDAKK